MTFFFSSLKNLRNPSIVCDLRKYYRCEAPPKLFATQTYGQGPAGTLTIGFEEQVKVWLARHGSHCPSSTVCECIIGRNWWTLLFAFHGLCCNNSITSKVSFQILQCLTQRLNFSLSSAQVRSTQTYRHTVCFEERIPSNRRGILELAAFHSSHYQLENEPFAKKNDQGSR